MTITGSKLRLATVRSMEDVNKAFTDIALYLQQSIQGPVGPAGPTGPAGAAGPAGPTGPVGPAGALEFYNQYVTFQAPFSTDLLDLKSHVLSSSTGVSIVGGKASFDGTGGLVYNSAGTFDMYSMPFCFEGWFSTSQTQQYTTLMERGSGGTTGDWELVINNTVNGGQLAFYQANLIAAGLVGGSGLNNGARHHFALAKAGTWYAIFGDGALLNFVSLTSYDVWPPNTRPLYIGNSQTAGRHLIGTMDNVRMMRGQPGYTVPFTVPTPPFPTA